MNTWARHRRQYGTWSKIGRAMVEIIRCNDPVLLTWVEALLKDAGINAMVLDQYTSAVGGHLLPVARRVLVSEEDEAAARRLLTDADLGDQLKTDD
jgi:hypothetical protein